MAAVALAGSRCSGRGCAASRGRWRAWRWQLLAPLLAYLLALAPVLLAGRASFSSYMALADSAVHMMGADFLLHHGQNYSHLDLRNSYGQFINGYYGTSYPSGADTLFGGSALLLGLPLIWAFQPFNAFMLAIAAGPAWLLVRRLGLNGGWAALAALTATVPALVYGYELVGSIKEITALSMILTLGALVVLHPRWLRGPPRGAIPFALVAAAGVSALGVGFGAWVLAAAVVLAVVLIGELAAEPSGNAAGARPDRPRRARRARQRLADLGAAVRIAERRAEHRLHRQPGQPSHAAARPAGVRHLAARQLQGGTGRRRPSLTHVLIAVTLVAALAGAVRVIRLREYPFAGWLALMLVAWLALSEYSTTWVDAKTLMLTSPAIVILAWGGVAALQSLARSASPRRCSALVLAGGVFASDALQYHSSNLAPTARYQELASVNSRFAGKGPTLFTDFDEYSLYELRDLDVGGPDFVFAPPALAASCRWLRRSCGPRPRIARGAARLPADRHPPRPRREPSTLRLPRWSGRAPTTRCGAGGRAPPRPSPMSPSRARPPLSARASGPWRRSRATHQRAAHRRPRRPTCGRGSRPLRRIPQTGAISATGWSCPTPADCPRPFDCPAREPGSCGCRARSCPQ